MATELRITQDEILATLAEATSGKGPGNAKTTTELQEEMGICRTYVVAALRELHKQGRLVPHQVRRAGYDGKLRPVTAFTILPAKKKR